MQGHQLLRLFRAMRLQILRFDFYILYSFDFESEVFWGCARGNASEYSSEFGGYMLVARTACALRQGAIQLLVPRVVFGLVGFRGNDTSMTLRLAGRRCLRGRII